MKSVFNSSGMVVEGSSFGHETVSAVARDLKGNIAAATSTGGISLKMVGHVGDTPLIGAGAYSNKKYWRGVLHWSRRTHCQGGAGTQSAESAGDVWQDLGAYFRGGNEGGPGGWT